MYLFNQFFLLGQQKLLLVMHKYFVPTLPNVVGLLSKM